MQAPYPFFVLSNAGCFMSLMAPRDFSITHPVPAKVNCPSFWTAYLYRKLTACLEGDEAFKEQACSTYEGFMTKIHEARPHGDDDWFVWTSLHLAADSFVTSSLGNVPYATVEHWEASHAHTWQTILLTYYCTDAGRKFFDDVIELSGSKELAYTCTDKAFGIGFSYDNTNIFKPETWTGENQYGKALQSFRDTLIKHPGAYATDPEEQSRFT